MLKPEPETPLPWAGAEWLTGDDAAYACHAANMHPKLLAGLKAAKIGKRLHVRGCLGPLGPGTENCNCWVGEHDKDIDALLAECGE